MSLVQRKNALITAFSMLKYRKWIEDDVKFDPSDDYFKVKGIHDIHIYMVSDKNFLKKKKYLEFIDDDPKIMLIISEDVYNKSYEDTIASDNIEIWILESFNMQYDISKHVLVNKHKIINFENEDEKKKFIKEELGSFENHMPTLFTHDPMARFLNAKVGDIVEVARPSGMPIRYRVESE